MSNQKAILQLTTTKQLQYQFIAEEKLKYATWYLLEVFYLGCWLF